jgi:hypothetical protein
MSNEPCAEKGWTTLNKLLMLGMAGHFENSLFHCSMPLTMPVTLAWVPACRGTGCVRGGAGVGTTFRIERPRGCVHSGWAGVLIH